MTEPPRMYKIPENLDDMRCFWDDFKKRYSTGKSVQLYICDKCDGEDPKCQFYIPLKEIGEYMGAN